MGFPVGRRPLLVGALASAAFVATTAGRASANDASADDASAAAYRPQVAFLNHTYTVLDRVTADAVAGSAYLREFGAFQLRTTTNGEQTYTGRYLLGRETYLEMFGPGDLPAPDDTGGSCGLALSPDREGGLDIVTRRLARLGVTDPLEITQTKEIDGEQVPWFDVVAPSPTYAATFPWVMEYLPSYFADPRTHSEPASFPGDVSRERYSPDDYRTHLMRDVTAVEIALPQEDVAACVAVLRAAGFEVCRTASGVVARGRSVVITLTRASRADSGWRRIEFALARSTPRHVERIGHSTLTVGPAARATWAFA